MFYVVVGVLNAKYGILEHRGERRAKQELVLAGYPDASASRVASIAQTWRCREQFERKVLVKAYVWKSGDQSGLYCIPRDGRPTKLLLDEQN